MQTPHRKTPADGGIELSTFLVGGNSENQNMTPLLPG